MSWTAETNIKGPPGPAGGIGEAPTDGQTYGRKNTAWSVVTGGGGGGAASSITVTPAGNISSTNVQAALQELDTEKVAKAGDSMTGLLVLSADPGVALGAATKQYVDGNIRAPATATPIVESGTGAVGTSVKYAREDHVHPLGPSVAPATATPIVESGSGAVGVSAKYAREDHVHPLSVSAGAVRYDIAQGLTPAQMSQARANIAVSARGHIWGLALSTAGASTTFAVALGSAMDVGGADIMGLGAGLTKTTAAWVVGSGTGALDTGAIAASTWYHMFLIKRPDTGVVDALVSLSATAPTLPANYTLFRRIGSMKTNASSQWLKFIQDGDLFTWDVPVNDVPIVTNPGTAAVTRTLASVPLGIRVRARLFAAIQATVIGYPGGFLVSDLAVADTPASVTAASIYFYNNVAATVVFGAPFEVMTNTAAQVRTRFESSNAGTNLYIDTIGWFDTRGRDA